MTQEPLKQEAQVRFSRLLKQQLLKRDVFGRTILHLLIITNSHNQLHDLLRNPDIAYLLQLTDYENDWNCLHYIVFHKRVTCFKVLLQYMRIASLKQNYLWLSYPPFTELLKSKDRNRYAPFQLLDNDCRDLLWIPSSINDNEIVDLRYRFESGATSNEEHPLGTPSRGNSASPLDPVLPPRRPYIRHCLIPWSVERGASDLYVFGSNFSGNLGSGDMKNKSLPTLVNHANFKNVEAAANTLEALKRPRYRLFLVTKYHSFVITESGALFSCGKGSRGRLGHGDTVDLHNFKRVEQSSSGDILPRISSIAASNNHLIILTTGGDVLTCGLNTFGQLGYSIDGTRTKIFAEPFSSKPGLVFGDLRKATEPIIGVAVSGIHSCAFTASTFYSWGLNLGQFGTPVSNPNIEYKVGEKIVRGSLQPNPRGFSLRDAIVALDTCEECTVVITVKSDIHVYSGGTHIKLPKIAQNFADTAFDLFHPTQLSRASRITKVVVRNISQCFLLLDNGEVMLFKINVSDPKLTNYVSLWKAYDRGTGAIDFDAGDDGSVIICTRNGSVFIKNSSSITNRRSSVPDIVHPVIAKGKFRRLNNLNKVVRVSCDTEAVCFGFLRDEVDVLPFQIQKSDFVQDIAHLSCVNEPDVCRKQRALFEKDDVVESYVENFSSISSRDFANEDAEHDGYQSLITDILKVSYLQRSKQSRFRSRKLTEIYTEVSDGEIEILAHKILSDSSYLTHYYGMKDNTRGYDCHITLSRNPGVLLGFHKKIFMSRCPIFERIFSPQSDDEFFVEGSFAARFDRSLNTFHVDSDIDMAAMLIFIHFIYTGQIIDVWSKCVPNSAGSVEIKTTKKDFEKLCAIFFVSLTLQESGFAKFLAPFQHWLESNDGDISVRLKDGSLRIHSFLLRARSAYFETFFSDGWDELDELDFVDYTTYQFTVVLRFLHGALGPDNLFREAPACGDSDAFVNDLLLIVALSDELMLFPLKSLCQLAISPFITTENVCVLLCHGDALSATKLFINCAWFIYNNLDVILFDPHFVELPVDMLLKLERQLEFFQTCKLAEKVENSGSKSLNWLSIDNDQLFRTFLDDLDIFNECFVSDRKGFSAFEPLVDAKHRSATSGSSSKKRSKSIKASRASRLSTSIENDIGEFRKSVRGGVDVVGTTSVFEESGSDLTQRRVTKIGKSPPRPLLDDLQILQAGLSASDSDRKLVGFSGELESRYPSTPPYSLSRSGSASSVQDDSKGSSTLSEVRSAFKATNTASAGKVKIGPITKLSQKERKRLAASTTLSAPSPPALDTKSVNPWKTLSPQPSASASLLQATEPMSNKKHEGPTKIKSLRTEAVQAPVFSKPSWGSAAASSSVGTPRSRILPGTRKLSEIMIEESLQIELAREEANMRKSLLEIQQEQEFEKWWQEESARIQREAQEIKAPKAPQGGPAKQRRKSKKSIIGV